MRTDIPDFPVENPPDSLKQRILRMAGERAISAAGSRTAIHVRATGLGTAAAAALVLAMVAAVPATSGEERAGLRIVDRVRDLAATFCKAEIFGEKGDLR